MQSQPIYSITWYSLLLILAVSILQLLNHLHCILSRIWKIGWWMFDCHGCLSRFFVKMELCLWSCILDCRMLRLLSCRLLTLWYMGTLHDYITVYESDSPYYYSKLILPYQVQHNPTNLIPIIGGIGAHQHIISTKPIRITTPLQISSLKWLSIIQLKSFLRHYY